MAKLVIKVENEYLQLAAVSYRRSRVFINKVRRFELPINLLGKAKLERPEEIVDFIKKCISQSGIYLRDLIILFDSTIIEIREYRYKNTLFDNSRLGGNAKERLTVIFKDRENGQGENDTETSIADNVKKKIYETYSYGNHRDNEGKEFLAIFDVEEDFIRAFADRMKSNDHNIVFIGSALLGYAETMNSLLKNIYREENLVGKNIITLDFECRCLRLCVFGNGNLLHQAEINFNDCGEEDLLIVAEQSIESAVGDLGESLPFRVDYIFYSGELSDIANLEKKLVARTNIPCRNINYYYGTVKYYIDLGGELAGRKGLYSRLISSAGIKPGNYKSGNLVYGGEERRKFRRVIYIISIALFVALALVLGSLYMNTGVLERSKANNLKDINSPLYEDAREIITERNKLNTEIQMYENDTEYARVNNNFFKEVFTFIGSEIIGNGTIETASIQDEGSMLVIFTSDKVQNLDEIIKIYNKRNLLTITEAEGSESIDGDMVRFYLKLSREGFDNER